jgi:RNA polymerase sigma-70 factor, ECF subfamily
LRSIEHEDPDIDLVERCKTGDRVAFRLLVEKYERTVFSTVVSVVGQSADADDIAQEVFLKMHRSIKNFKGECRFSVWLYRVTVNQCLDRIKHQKRRPQPVSLDGMIEASEGGFEGLFKDTSPDASEEYEQTQLQQAIQKVLNSLSAEHRVVITLKDIEGRSQEQIAEILKCPVGTIKSRLTRAREALKERLRPFYETWISGE